MLSKVFIKCDFFFYLNGKALEATHSNVYKHFPFNCSIYSSFIIKHREDDDDDDDAIHVFNSIVSH